MSALPTRAELEAEKARRSLRVFMRLAWPILEPATGVTGATASPATALGTIVKASTPVGAIGSRVIRSTRASGGASPAPFLSNWHIDAICDHLEAVARAEIRRLLINLPPRHMKSLLVSVMFLPWVWASAPERRFLHASYAQQLAIRDS